MADDHMQRLVRNPRQEFPRLLVIEMAVAGAYTVLETRRIIAVRQHGHVVIGFHEQMCALKISIDNMLGHAAEVTQDTDTFDAVIEHKLRGFTGIVRDTHRIHPNAVKLKGHVAVKAVAGAVESSCGAIGGINRNRVLVSQGAHPGDVIPHARG